MSSPQSVYSDDAGVHAVREAALLADLLEQPARHAAAEDLVGDGEREAVGSSLVERPPAERDVGLLGRSCSTTSGFGRRPARARAGARRPARRPPRNASTPSTTSSWSRRPGGGDDHVRGPVVVAEEAGDLVAGHRLDACRRRRAPRGRADARGTRVGEQRVHLVVGRVLGHADLLEDDLALGVDLVALAAPAARQHVAQQVESERRASSAGSRV